MALEIGSKAPSFTLPDANGQNLSLEQFKNKWIVLYFYPKDDTPGCTTEACSFSEALPNFSLLNAIVIGISPDSSESHLTFSKKYSLNIHLASDTERKAINSYGVWGKKNMYGKEYEGVIRSTFLIDPQGQIAAIWRNVKVQGHTEEVKAALEKWQKT